MKPALHGYYERLFVAVQECTVPRSRNFSDERKQESLRLINEFLCSRPASVRLRLRLFLISLDALSLLSAGGRFCSLPVEKQTRVLNRVFDSSIGIIRKGFWGLNTLTRLGVYGQTALHNEIGYRLKPTPHDRQAS